MGVLQLKYQKPTCDPGMQPRLPVTIKSAVVRELLRTGGEKKIAFCAYCFLNKIEMTP